MQLAAGWAVGAAACGLEDGAAASCCKDAEGNDSGVLFGHDKKNKEFFTVGNQAVDTSHLSNEEFGEFIRQ